jgi:hypothetical protein
MRYELPDPEWVAIRLTPRCNRISFRIQFAQLMNWRWGYKLCNQLE